MIRLILGQPGSGKTLTAVKTIHDAEDQVFTNFRVRLKDVERIKMEDVILVDRDETGKLMPKTARVNWDFWKATIKRRGGFHIIIDELHNIMHSRMAMSKQNILMSQWVAQIRKVTGENERFDFVCVSQEIGRVDIAVRDLTSEIVHCRKFETGEELLTIVYENGRKREKVLPETWIIKTVFKGMSCVQRYLDYRDFNQKTYSKRTGFLANPYMKFYDSYELVNFGETAYL